MTVSSLIAGTLAPPAVDEPKVESVRMGRVPSGVGGVTRNSIDALHEPW
jgi:hypothetical protein